MGIIKGVLKEELKNSLRMKKEYQKALAKMGKGTLVAKIIRGHQYYYQVYREKGKLVHKYIGKLTKEGLQAFRKGQRQRKQYIVLIKRLDLQIKFIRRSLRGKTSD